MTIRIEISGSVDAAVAEKLNKLKRRGALMNNLGLMAERETKMNFAKEVSPDDAGWAATQRGGSILRDTGTLVGGIAMTSASQDEAIVQSTAGAEYGIFHQTGTSKMPARPYIGIGNRIRTKAEKIVQNWWGD
jgi:phage gpG-like protein